MRRICGGQRPPRRRRRRSRRHRQVRLRGGDVGQRRRREGRLLDAAVRRADPNWPWNWAPIAATARCASPAPRPTAEVFSVELSAANADVARRIWAHAGLGDRISCVVGTLGDGGRTLDVLAADTASPPGAGFRVPRPRQARLPARPAEHSRPGWLHPGRSWSPTTSGCPGAPKYRAYMRDRTRCGTPSSTRPMSNISLCSRPGARVGIPGLARRDLAGESPRLFGRVADQRGTRLQPEEVQPFGDRRRCLGDR